MVIIFVLTACSESNNQSKNQGNQQSENQSYNNSINESNASSNSPVKEQDTDTLNTTQGNGMDEEASSTPVPTELPEPEKTASGFTSYDLKPEYQVVVDSICAAFEKGYQYQEGQSQIYRKGDYTMLQEGNTGIYTTVVGKKGDKIYMSQMDGEDYAYIWEYDRVGDNVGEGLKRMIEELEAYSTATAYMEGSLEWRIKDVKLEAMEDTTVITVERLLLDSESEKIVEVYYIRDGLLDKGESHDLYNDYEFVYDYVSRGPIDESPIITYYNATKEKFDEMD